MPKRRRERADSFLFEPRRFMDDPAVQGMSVTAVGAYALLFCSAWHVDDPGVLPDNDRVLASLARMDLAEWLAVRDQVARAFDTSQPGVWIQKGLRRTLEAQDRYFIRQQRHGSDGGKAKAANMKARVPSTSLEAASSEPLAYTRFSVRGSTVLGTETPESESTPESEPSPRATHAAPRGPAFVKPTLEELAAYCRERRNTVDPQAWLDHYTANGWRIGRSPMRDWRAAVRTWERNGFTANGTGRQPSGKLSAADIQRFRIAQGES